MSGKGKRGKPSAGIPFSPAPSRPPVQPSNIDLDLHGLTVREALAAVERRLEWAQSDRLHILKVIHGHGTGALKNAVRKYLSESPLVSRHYFASYGDGGHGVTIAELEYGKGKPYNRRANNEISPKQERWK